jgi:beta-glucosidase/6-phospho-beta-glucosidase/beta-galactosidase
MRFGLIAVDRQTQDRKVKPSGWLLARIAEQNALAAPAPFSVRGEG